jgi:hypothetical protein
MTTDIEQTPSLRKASGPMGLITLALAALLLIVGLIAFSSRVYDLTPWTYRSHQHELTAIVAQIKAQSIPLGTAREFELARSLDLTTLAPYKERADRASFDHIRAYHNDQDEYLISIEIDDEGHDGTYGLLYSDSPIKIIPMLDSRGGSNPRGGSIDVGWSYVHAGEHSAQRRRTEHRHQNAVRLAPVRLLGRGGEEATPSELPHRLERRVDLLIEPCFIA